VTTGGPGNSGVEFVAGLGELYQKIVGEQYDIVGFDPRFVLMGLRIDFH
jgi:hypothetical protein